MRRVRHHLIDIKYPDEDWSVSEVPSTCQEGGGRIAGRGRLPCIVGIPDST